MRNRRLAAILAVSFALAGAATFVAIDARSEKSALGPLATYAFANGARLQFEGKVVGRCEAGSYIYLEVEQSGGRKDWVVTLASSKGAARGVDHVRIIAVGHADHFASKRLSRTFESLYFAVVRPA
jgi:hypothetical protein